MVNSDSVCHLFAYLLLFSGFLLRFDSVLFVSLQQFLDSGILLAPVAREGLSR
jgi:hypothetical protein